MDAGDKKRILLIDDSKPITSFLTIKLKNSGFDVAAAYDGESGLEMARQMDPNLILLDVIMPGMNGLEVLRRLREFSRAPVVMLTAAEGVRDESIKLGASDFFSKPFSLDGLMARINFLI